MATRLDPLPDISTSTNARVVEHEAEPSLEGKVEPAKELASMPDSFVRTPTPMLGEPSNLLSNLGPRTPGSLIRSLSAGLATPNSELTEKVRKLLVAVDRRVPNGMAEVVDSWTSDRIWS